VDSFSRASMGERFKRGIGIVSGMSTTENTRMSGGAEEKLLPSRRRSVRVNT